MGEEGASFYDGGYGNVVVLCAQQAGQVPMYSTAGENLEKTPLTTLTAITHTTTATKNVKCWAKRK